MPPEGVNIKPLDRYMNGGEVVDLAKTFVDLGVKKIRLTGGEPLVRKDAAEIIKELGKLPIQLGVSTNGVLLDRYFEHFKDLSNLNINISLDSLNAEKNQRITRRDYFERITGNIRSALDRGYIVKLNVVVIRDLNDDEILDFIDLTKDKNLEVRFIEFMPFLGNKWDRSLCVSSEQIMGMARDHYHSDNISTFPCEGKTINALHQVVGFTGKFGIISTVSDPFCGSCDRIRLTADGKIRNCLFSDQEIDLLTALRKGEDVEQLIRRSIFNKHERWGGRTQIKDGRSPNSKIRSMTSIGG